MPKSKPDDVLIYSLKFPYYGEMRLFVVATAILLLGLANSFKEILRYFADVSFEYKY